MSDGECRPGTGPGPTSNGTVNVACTGRFVQVKRASTIASLGMHESNSLEYLGPVRSNHACLRSSGPVPARLYGTIGRRGVTESRRAQPVTGRNRRVTAPPEASRRLPP